MKKNIFILALLLITAITNSFGQADDLQDNINLIKQNLIDSKESIKKYEWIETATVFIKGEQKSVKQNQCYYALDGTLTKVPTGNTTQSQKKGGIRGAIIENKKEDMADYIEKALAKIKTYMPLQPEKIQQIYAAGKVGIQILEPGKKYKLSFPDYLQTGDVLSITLDKVNKFMTGYSINTFMADATDPVSLNIVLKTLPDKTSYPGEVTFNSEKEKIKIVLVNNGYKVGGGR